MEAYDLNEGGLERITSTWFESYLIQHWITAVPDVQASVYCNSVQSATGQAKLFIPSGRFGCVSLSSASLSPK